jgi:hypothetical protein
MDKEFLKLEADRLSKDPIFLKAVARMRATALEDLVTVDASDTTAVLKIQAKVWVCDGMASELEAMIHSAQERRPIKAI